MTEIKAHSPEEVIPDRDAVFDLQGIPRGTDVNEETGALYSRAVGLLRELASPFSIIAEMSDFDFDVVYYGDGLNEPKTPIGDIYTRADYLALFAVTIGEVVCREIEKRFAANDLALASMLDSVASAATDKLARHAEGRFHQVVSGGGEASAGMTVLSYSPGYCGWHVSGQKRLFDFLRPQQIGISLNDSCLMRPLKSVSGVLVAGPKEIHSFPASYPACRQCETHDCRERIDTASKG